MLAGTRVLERTGDSLARAQQVLFQVKAVSHRNGGKSYFRLLLKLLLCQRSSSKILGLMIPRFKSNTFA